jgi:uridine monophosphate synthetase
LSLKIFLQNKGVNRPIFAPKLLITKNIMETSFLNSLVEIGCIKFGDFTLKSGHKSPIYIDLREIISYPNLLQDLAKIFVQKINTNHQLICGVPYAALPMATALSLYCQLPMIIKRKEAKKYGAKKLIEGKYSKGDRVIVIEDVITSGISLEETIQELEAEGLIIDKILVVLNREQGGLEKLQSKGYTVEALYSLSSMLMQLKQEQPLLENEINTALEFLNNPIATHQATTSQKHILPKSHINPKAHQLLQIAHSKQSNIIASIDLVEANEILNLLEKIGHKICAVKLHIDIVKDFSWEFISRLKSLAVEKNFMIIEDRKFADIGNTQILQLTQGVYEIAKWADFVTIQMIAGELSLKAIEDLNIENKPALLPIVEMSSKGALTDEHYIEQCKTFIHKYSAVVGAVCQKTALENDLLKFTPGISLNNKEDNKGQQFNTPTYAINNLKAHFLIIGRDIYQSTDPLSVVENYLIEVNNTSLF